MSKFDDDALLAKMDRQMSRQYIHNWTTAEEYWHKLIRRIESLRLPGDEFEIVTPNCFGAWQMAFAIYEKLRDRSRLPRSEKQISDALLRAGD